MDTYGLLGRNISYSLSPVMHNAAFKHYVIPAEYVLLDKKEEELNDFFEKDVLGGKIKGFNITVPYKIKTKEFLESKGYKLHKWASVTGSVNTVDPDKGMLIGHNTDVIGFYASVQQNFDIAIGPKREYTFFIAGAGGAGRAIALYVAFMGAKRIYVFDIDTKSLESLRARFDEFDPSVRDKFRAVRAEDVVHAVEEADLLVNATPLGTQEGSAVPIPLEALREGQAVYDLVYARKTELLEAAEEKGLKCADGLGMLINQAAKAFEIWTGKPFGEVERIMRKAAIEEIARR